MFRLDEFLEKLPDAKQAIGSQRHTDDDDGRYVPGDHLESSAAAAATQSSLTSLSSTTVVHLRYLLSPDVVDVILCCCPVFKATPTIVGEAFIFYL